MWMNALEMLVEVTLYVSTRLAALIVDVLMATQATPSLVVYNLFVSLAQTLLLALAAMTDLVLLGKLDVSHYFNYLPWVYINK